MKIWRKHAGSTTKSLPPVIDPVLGELRLAEDASWWEGQVTIEGQTVGFCIGGKDKPDAGLVAHAQDIVRSLPEFQQTIAAFLADKADSVKHLAHFAGEIRQLTVEDICLLWPNRPDDGMIYFKGPDKFRIWRCDYIARKPQKLCFDD